MAASAHLLPIPKQAGLLHLIGSKIADKLYTKLRAHQCKGTRPCAFGALDAVRVTFVYVSGLQFSSVASTSFEPGRRRGLLHQHGTQQGRPALRRPVLLRPQAVRGAPLHAPGRKG
mmetsp:Transcript_128920/g.412118  ORF Transcript_128920/g.412118 Transcript_128920/m.412118 type:complete len:116 (-) Transcript_128920:103-450(-)